MEFYKIEKENGRYILQEEAGQAGEPITQQMLAQAVQLQWECYQKPESAPLAFRKYITAYFADGTISYVAMADWEQIPSMQPMDGFACTWLEGEEENRVWIGEDGAVENRGPSTEKVKQILQRILELWNATEAEKETR